MHVASNFYVSLSISDTMTDVRFELLPDYKLESYYELLIYCVREKKKEPGLNSIVILHYWYLTMFPLDFFLFFLMCCKYFYAFCISYLCWLKLLSSAKYRTLTKLCVCSQLHHFVVLKQNESNTECDQSAASI